jgi:hypothetical protein
MGRQSVRVLLRLEGLDKDHARQVVGYHYVLVAAPCAEREPSCVVSVQLSVMGDAHVEFVCGRVARHGCSFIQGRWGWSLCAVA